MTKLNKIKKFKLNNFFASGHKAKVKKRKVKTNDQKSQHPHKITRSP